MHTAVVGGGINGVMTAWALARRGCRVTLFERDRLMSATSAASTKLLHGGVRYLESGHIALVREALRERAWWIEQAPHIAHALPLLLPVYEDARRARWKLRAGLALYDLLAGRKGLGPTRWLSRAEVASRLPGLRSDGLIGAYEFYDAQMDDQALGLWAARQAEIAGAVLRSGVEVLKIGTGGEVDLIDGSRQVFDRVLNVSGPWAARLLARSGIEARHAIDPVRGSHLLIERPLPQGVVVEMPESERVCFVLPYQGRTLVGTTEVRQSLDAPIACSEAERVALKRLHDTYFQPSLSADDGIVEFAGLRPLLRSAADPTRASREAALERHGNVVTVFGGKWTTARALGERAARLALS